MHQVEPTLGTKTEAMRSVCNKLTREDVACVHAVEAKADGVSMPDGSIEFQAMRL